MTDVIRVTATGRASGYMPEFVAREFGHFENHDVEVETIVPHDWEDVVTGIASGEHDLALGGVWVPAMYRGHGREMVVTGQMCHRAAFALISRDEPTGPWLEQIDGKAIMVPGRGGASGGIYLDMWLRENDIDPARARISHDLTDAMMGELYHGGFGDALQVGIVEAKTWESKGHTVVLDLLEDGGDIPWSVYYTTPETVAAKGDAIARFNTALEEAMAFMNGTPAAEFVPQVMKWYPGVSESHLIASIERMRALRMWTGTRLREDTYMRWQNGVVRGGLLDSPVSLRDIAVDFARVD
ncbi:ABC transporter substrate-binding protein [Demequina zhanjiangensis]|uniref:Thiamine pyrimidine synthase n=1 Tax=Demequina zhanjiangensis TaxID=3051659 RepID=A0ABT8FZC2_9MICO|nr:ABC transporter substrate-binding protein [Demequina sp. SYSU T00b26]MDN4472244.1 ABC transporter substrate-binding protein [Demequina sp. SYSU T00b26]